MSTYSVGTDQYGHPAIFDETGFVVADRMDVEIRGDVYDAITLNSDESENDALWLLITRAVAAQDLLARDPEVLRAEPMSAERRAEIADRLHHASDGPWTFQHWGGQNQNGDYAESILFDGDGETMVYGLSNCDGEFIAATRQDVTDLLAEVNRLTAVVAQQTEDYKHGSDILGATIRHLQATLRQLTEPADAVVEAAARVAGQGGAGVGGGE